MMYGLEHPGITEMNNKGCIGPFPKTFAICELCGFEIEEGEEYFDMEEEGGPIICENCEYDYVKKYMEQFRKVATLV